MNTISIAMQPIVLRWFTMFFKFNRIKNLWETVWINNNEKIMTMIETRTKYFRKPVSLKIWREKEVNDILISDLCAFHTDHRDAGIKYNFQFSFIYVTSLHKMPDVHETHMFTLFCNMRMFFQLPLKKHVFGTMSLTWYWIRMFLRKGLGAQSAYWINTREINCYYNIIIIIMLL